MQASLVVAVAADYADLPAEVLRPPGTWRQLADPDGHGLALSCQNQQRSATTLTPLETGEGKECG
jgi:hypothetical protein